MNKKYLAMICGIFLVGLMSGLVIAGALLTTNIPKATTDNLKAQGAKDIVIGDVYSNGEKLMFNVTVNRLINGKANIQTFVVTRLIEGREITAQLRDDLVNEEIEKRYSPKNIYNKVLDGGIITLE